MVTWLECPRCGGVWVVQRSPEKPPGLYARYYMHRDGSPVAPGEPQACDDCGAIGWKCLLLPHYDDYIRHADALPSAPARTQQRSIGRG